MVKWKFPPEFDDVGFVKVTDNLKQRYEELKSEDNILYNTK
jgi:hypothetical protein